VLLVDASASGAAPFEASPLRPAADASLGSHALSPQGLLHLAGQWPPGPPPPCTLLAIRGEAFELGALPGPAALAHLDAALAWSRDWLAAKEDPRR
jgi:hypothetical protein